MGIKLIAFDLDGTFLDPKKNIHPDNIKALEAAAAKDVVIVPATGRIVGGVPPQIRELPFVRYYVTANGAFVYDALEDKAVARAEIPLEEALSLLRYEDGLGIPYDCYQDGWGYMSAGMKACAGDFVPDPGILNLVLSLRTEVPELKEYLRRKGESVQKLQLYFTDMQERERQFETLPGMFPDMAFTTSVPFNIEINSSAATKGQGLAALCRLLDIKPEEVLAFGDDRNDADMIRFAGVGVAMENAIEELRAAADWVTASNAGAGVARGIEHFVLGSGSE